MHNAQPLPTTSTALAPAETQRLMSAVSSFSAEQLMWASGYLAGLAAPTATPDVAPVAAPALTVLYGSQTGNGRRVAEALADELAAQGRAARLINAADYRPAQIKKETHLALVVSTHGEGDPPDDIEALLAYLSGPKAPTLDTLNFAVLALGDSSYEHFCKTGRDFDKRLSALGASRWFDLVACDVDYAAAAGSWREQILAHAAEQLPAAAAPNHAGPALFAVPDATRFSAEAPLRAALLTNQKITGRDSAKDIRHLEFNIEGSGLTYSPGDSLGVIARNPPRLVDDIIAATGTDANAPVSVDGVALPLAEALETKLEITGVSRRFLEALHGAVPDAALSTRLAPEVRRELAAWMQTRQVIDVLREHPHADAIEPQMLVDTLRPLTPRLYSIASGPALNPDEVHLTVAAVRYDAFGSEHVGAASTFLADRIDEGDAVEIYVEPNPRFRLPADDVPIIMIGPGTGIAPFRAFLEEREARGASGRNWLFFGNPHQHSDFLYQIELLRWRKQGLLDRLDVAFSRDQAHKIYVQDRLREQGRELYTWLEDGAHVYVCGDASRMAPDVDAALADVIASGAGIDIDAARARLTALKQDGRYLRDVY